MISVDLGCGAHRRLGTTYGVDLRPGPDVTHVCAIGFEPLPFADASIHQFWATDFLEHLPAQVWWRAGMAWQVHYPRIFCLREVYRCLVPGGGFCSLTPVGEPEWAQDPTHCAPPWREETWDYFCGQMGDVPGYYGIDFAFELLERKRTGPQASYLWVVVRKPYTVHG